jgi:hypothetical protein
MISLDIYEDIFSATMQGSIEISDSNDLISTFKIHGNEFLDIEIERSTLEETFKKTFRIYKISDRKIKDGAQNYTMYFCSEEFFLSSQILLSKSYKGLTTGEIIYDIVSNVLKTNPKKINQNLFETIEVPMDIIIPRLQPFEAIYWLLSRSFGTNNSLYFFYETRDGFNLSSYENLLKKTVYSDYYPSVKINNLPEENINSFTFLQIQEDFDLFRSARFGTFSSRLYNLDIVSKQYQKFDHNIFRNKSSGILNKELPMNSFKNRLGFDMYNSYEGMTKYAITNDADTTRNPIQANEWMVRKFSRLGQLQSFKMIGTIPGDPLMKAGLTINVEFPKLNPQEKNNIEMNSLRTGKYLVTAVHHSYKINIHSTVVELLSDSVNDYMNAPVESPILKKLREA